MYFVPNFLHFPHLKTSSLLHSGHLNPVELISLVKLALQDVHLRSAIVGRTKRHLKALR